MCLATPARILERDGDRGLVEKDGLRFDVDLSLVPEAKVGDSIVVHVGLALAVLEAEDAESVLDAHRELKGSKS